MSRFNKKVAESNFEPPDEGAYYAACVALVDLGTQEDEYKGDVTHNEKVYLAWELLGQTDGKGRPFIVSAAFNLFISPTSKFGKFLSAWRGKKLAPNDDMDLRKLVGAKCQLTVTHKKTTKEGKEYTNVEVAAVTPIVKGTAVPEPITTPFMWEFDSGPFREPDWLPRYYGKTITDVISESMEARGFTEGSNPEPSSEAAPVASAVAVVEDDDIPF